MKSIIWIYIILIYIIKCINCENITITVGERGLSFSPKNATVRYNDNIKWLFLGGKHQIVQSDGPAGSCIKSSRTNAFTSILQEGGEYNYTITQTSGTIYYFCSYSSHCAYGMWGTINIDTSVPTALPSTTDTTTNVPAPADSSNADNLPIIIGSSIGGFFALAIIGLIIFMVYRRNKYQKQFEVAMQPYDPKLNVGGGGHDRANNSSSNSNIGVSGTALPVVDNTNLLSRSNTKNTNAFDEHSTNEVIEPSIAPSTQLNDEIIRNYEEKANSEYGVYRGPSTRESLYQYSTINDGERSERSSRSPLSLSPPPTYNPTLNPVYNPYDSDVIYQQQQQQQQQQPPIPPRPTNIVPSQQPSQQQYGAPFLPPRPLAVNRYPPQYGPSSSPTFQEPQFINVSSDPFGPPNPGQYYQQQQPQQPQQIRQSLPRPPPPPPSQPLPPPSQPLPPPPIQQQTGQYSIDPAQYYGSNNSDN